MPISIKCKQCEKEFFVKPSRLDEKKFCSRECKNKSGRIEIICLNCNKKFTKIAFRSDAIFCDRNCKTEYSNNKHICEKCGKEFKRGKSYEGAARFCSVECRRTEGCQGIKNCEKCDKQFYWQRGKNQIEPKYCSLICRGHTGFRPGGQLFISEMTEEQKFERLKKSFEKHVIRNENGCWGWKGSVAHGGYPVMSCRPEIGPDRGHRASWVIHNGPIPEGLNVCHNCPDGDNPICTNPDHLWLGTQKQNNDDKIAKGRERYTPPPHKKGIENGASKLTEEQVIEIKKLLKEGKSTYFIGPFFGVSKTTILRIKKGTHWTHVKTP